MAEPMSDVCGARAPWGAICVSAPGHPMAHDWRDRAMTPSEVGDALGLSSAAVKRIAPAELPYFTVGTRRDRRYVRADVLAYVAARRVG